MTNPTNTQLTLIVDRSGSMGHIAKDMNGGITALLEEQAKLDGELFVDIVTFDNTVEEIVLDASPAEALLQDPYIVPRGSTALLDAIGKTVVRLGERLADLDEDERPGKVIVAIVTDGEENASREWTNVQTIRDLVQKQIDEFSWDFIFLGANIDAIGTGGSFGFAQGSSMNYTADSHGVAVAAASVSSYLTARRGGDDTSTLADFGKATVSN